MTELYTPKQAREILKISALELQRLVVRGKIQRITPPGRHKGAYLKSQIDSYAKELDAFRQQYTFVDGA